jgi:hypothetical protein
MMRLSLLPKTQPSRLLMVRLSLLPKTRPSRLLMVRLSLLPKTQPSRLLMMRLSLLRMMQFSLREVMPCSWPMSLAKCSRKRVKVLMVKRDLFLAFFVLCDRCRVSEL